MAFRRDRSNEIRPLSVKDDDDPEHALVIGIDLGKIYTKVAWGTRADFERSQVNLITSWPDKNHEVDYVPTELWYNDDDEPVWGYGVPADSDPFRWFKLLLLRADDLGPELSRSEFVTRSREMMEQSGRTAMDLVTDYLGLLWGHIMSTIERVCGKTVVEAFPIHVVITVPAIWKSYARKAMEDAAERAGILEPRMAGDTKLTFVPELEAAALSTLLEQGDGIRPGDVYVICDAGGGTVDLISYEVKSTERITLQEAVEGTGGLCGAIIIDQAFEHMCMGRLGSKRKRLSKMGMREIVTDQWEYGIKRLFKPVQGRKCYVVALPAEAFRGQSPSSLDDTSREPYIKNGHIFFLSSDIEKPFKAVFGEIEELVEGQVRGAVEKGLSVTGIVLVGGLGESSYLYEYLKAAHSEAGTPVLQSGNIKPSMAICRGAVIKGALERLREPSASPIHLMEDREWDETQGKYQATNQMRWYLKQGEPVLDFGVD